MCCVPSEHERSWLSTASLALQPRATLDFLLGIQVPALLSVHTNSLVKLHILSFCSSLLWVLNFPIRLSSFSTSVSRTSPLLLWNFSSSARNCTAITDMQKDRYDSTPSFLVKFSYIFILRLVSERQFSDRCVTFHVGCYYTTQVVKYLCSVFWWLQFKTYTFG